MLVFQDIILSAGTRLPASSSDDSVAVTALRRRDRSIAMHRTAWPHHETETTIESIRGFGANAGSMGVLSALGAR